MWHVISTLAILSKHKRKVAKRKKQERDQAVSRRNIELQSESNAKAAEAAAAVDIQKNQVMTENKVKMGQAQTQFDIQKLEREAAIKKDIDEGFLNDVFRLDATEPKAISPTNRPDELVAVAVHKRLHGMKIARVTITRH